MRMTRCMVVWMAGCVAVLAEKPATSSGKGAIEPGVEQVDSAGDVSALVMSGRECLADGKWTQAMALFEKARSLQPSNNEVAFGLSAAYIETKRYAEALPLLETLTKAVPDSPMVKNNLAWVLLHVKDAGGTNVTRAVKLARAAVLNVPSDYAIWNTLGEAYYAAARYDKALQAAESGLRLSLLAGVTNSPCRELVIRCRKAAGVGERDAMDSDRP